MHSAQLSIQISRYNLRIGCAFQDLVCQVEQNFWLFLYMSAYPFIFRSRSRTKKCSLRLRGPVIPCPSDDKVVKRLLPRRYWSVSKNTGQIWSRFATSSWCCWVHTVSRWLARRDCEPIETEETQKTECSRSTDKEKSTVVLTEMYQWPLAYVGGEIEPMKKAWRYYSTKSLGVRYSDRIMDASSQ